MLQRPWECICGTPALADHDLEIGLWLELSKPTAEFLKLGALKRVFINIFLYTTESQRIRYQSLHTLWQSEYSVLDKGDPEGFPLNKYHKFCCWLVARLCLTLWPHRLQHTRLPCPSVPPRVAQIHVHWIGDAIQPSHPLSPSYFFYLQFSPASGSFPMSWLFASGGQSIGASGSVLPMIIQGWFPSRLTGLISLQSKGLYRIIFSKPQIQKQRWVNF